METRHCNITELNYNFKIEDIGEIRPTIREVIKGGTCYIIKVEILTPEGDRIECILRTVIEDLPIPDEDLAEFFKMQADFYIEHSQLGITPKLLGSEIFEYGGRKWMLLTNEGENLQEGLNKALLIGANASLERRISFLRKLAGALDTLHKENWPHGDLSLKNVLATIEPIRNSVEVRIIDPHYGRNGKKIISGHTPSITPRFMFEEDVPDDLKPKVPFLRDYHAFFLLCLGLVAKQNVYQDWEADQIIGHIKNSSQLSIRKMVQTLIPNEPEELQEYFVQRILETHFGEYSYRQGRSFREEIERIIEIQNGNKEA